MKLSTTTGCHLALSNKLPLKIFFVVVVTTSILIAGCASVKTQYYSARTEGTISAYKQFLTNNPRGLYTKKAQKSLEQLQFREAIKSGNPQKLEALINATKFPKSNHAREALEALARLKAAELKQNETLKGYQSFYSRFGKTLAASELEKSFDTFYGRLALSTNQLNDYTGYITRFPNGQLTAAARKRGEVIWWSKKSRGARKKDYQDYLDLFPGGPHQRQVKKVLEKIMWNEAKKTSTDSVLFRSYLDRFPKGAYSTQARDYLDWSIAEKEGPIGIRSYLNTHRKGQFAKRGRKILKTATKTESKKVRDAAWVKVRTAIRQTQRYGGGSMSMWGSISSGKTHISYKGSVKSGGQSQITINNGSLFEYSGKIYKYYSGVWFPEYNRFFKAHKK